MPLPVLGWRRRYPGCGWLPKRWGHRSWCGSRRSRCDYRLVQRDLLGRRRTGCCGHCMRRMVCAMMWLRLRFHPMSKGRSLFSDCRPPCLMPTWRSGLHHWRGRRSGGNLWAARRDHRRGCGRSWSPRTTRGSPHQVNGCRRSRTVRACARNQQNCRRHAEGQRRPSMSHCTPFRRSRKRVRRN